MNRISKKDSQFISADTRNASQKFKNAQKTWKTI